MKSGSLNLLEPSGPVKACNGIALPLPLLISVSHIIFIPLFKVYFIHILNTFKTFTTLVMPVLVFFTGKILNIIWLKIWRKFPP
jgi:hypothetical protein